VDISAALAADLAVLTESLHEPGADISRTLRQLATDARIAVRSYLGLSAVLAVGGYRLAFTALEDDARPEDIRASLRISFPPDVPAADEPAATTSLFLFAASPGAFLDLAADLGWLTTGSGGLGTAGFVLDEDLTVPHDPAAPSGLKTQSTVDQAVGVLIGRGDTPGQAYQHLDRLAADAGVDRLTAAEAILAELDGPSRTDPDADDGHPTHPYRSDGEAMPTRPPRDP